MQRKGEGTQGGLGGSVEEETCRGLVLGRGNTKMERYSSLSLCCGYEMAVDICARQECVVRCSDATPVYELWNPSALLTIFPFFSFSFPFFFLPHTLSNPHPIQTLFRLYLPYRPSRQSLSSRSSHQANLLQYFPRLYFFSARAVYPECSHATRSLPPSMAGQARMTPQPHQRNVTKMRIKHYSYLWLPYRTSKTPCPKGMYVGR